MTESDWLAEGFEQNRARLRGVAYRMLGSLTEADDAVQDAWLRLSRSDASGVDNLSAWLTTIVARVCLNVLRSRQARREEPMGVHVPDAVISSASGTNPEEEALLADSVGLALQVVLDTLAPAERLAFVLHDMFDLPFDEIAPMLDRSPATTRQLASRARRRVRGADVQGVGAGPAPMPLASARSSMPSSPRPTTVTSKHSSRSSTRMSCCGPTGERRIRTFRWCSAARPPWPSGRSRSRSPPRRSGRSW